jgi:hypothetical protein
VILITLNLDPATAIRATIDVSSCGHVTHQRVFTETGEAPGLGEAQPATLDHGDLVSVLAHYSFSVIELSTDRGSVH